MTSAAEKSQFSYSSCCTSAAVKLYIWHWLKLLAPRLSNFLKHLKKLNKKTTLLMISQYHNFHHTFIHQSKRVFIKKIYAKLFIFFSLRSRANYSSRKNIYLKAFKKKGVCAKKPEKRWTPHQLDRKMRMHVPAVMIWPWCVSTWLMQWKKARSR